MAISELKKIQLDEVLTELSLHLTHMQKILNIVADRIFKLRQQEFFLETVFINSQYIEQLLKLTISSYAMRRRMLEFLGEKDIFEKVNLQLDDEETLGHLIGTLRRLKASPALIRGLGDFNNLRKEAIHHIFDGTKELETFNKNCGEYLASEEHTKILVGILEAHQKIHAEIKEIHRIATGGKKINTLPSPTA